MPEAATLVREVIGRCRDATFTGIVRIRGEQGEGVIEFLSGIIDEARLGTQTGDEAMQALEASTTRDINVKARLPGPNGGFKDEVPMQGDLAGRPPLELFRYCEGNAITCRLVLQSRGLSGEATYRMGELLTVRCEGDDNQEAAVSAMLGWNTGSYEFHLPPLVLPEGLGVAAPAAAPAPAMAADAPVREVTHTPAGGTAQADPDRANRVAAMRERAAQRAAEVAKAVEEARAARAAKVAKLAAEADYLQGQPMTPVEQARHAKAKAESDRKSGKTPAPTAQPAAAAPAPSPAPAPAAVTAGQVGQPASAHAATLIGMPLQQIAQAVQSAHKPEQAASPATPSVVVSDSLMGVPSPAPAAASSAPANDALQPTLMMNAMDAPLPMPTPAPAPAPAPAPSPGATVAHQPVATDPMKTLLSEPPKHMEKPAPAPAAAAAPAKQQEKATAQKEQEGGSNMGLILSILVLLAAGGGAAWYFFLR